MRMIRLLPQQVPKLWNLIKYAIEESVPPTSYGDKRVIAKAYEMLLAGNMEAWIAYEEELLEGRENPSVQISGVVVTTKFYDTITEIPTLLIWALCSMSPGVLKKEDWKYGLEIIREYAKGCGCVNLLAFTDSEQISSLAEALGGKSRFLLTFDL